LPAVQAQLCLHLLNSTAINLRKQNMNTSASNNFSPNYDSTPLPAYLHGAQLVPSTWRPPTKAEWIEGFRQRMMRDLRQMPPTGLKQFFATVISDDPLVGVCFLPKQVRYAGKQYRQLPYDLSLQAAKNAASMEVLLPPERGVAWIGSRPSWRPAVWTFVPSSAGSAGKGSTFGRDRRPR
jgi:hypothetical protein